MEEIKKIPSELNQILELIEEVNEDEIIAYCCESAETILVEDIEELL